MSRFEPRAWLRRRWKRLAILVVVMSIGMNWIAARHARAFLVYTHSAEPVPRPESLTLRQKAAMLVVGPSIPRPENRRTPQHGYTTHRVPIGNEHLELWHIPAPRSSRGVVLMFPGYAAAKDTLLHGAAAFHEWDLDVVLVDFRGAGGSSGSENTIGIREADDVAAAVDFVRARWAGQKLILFGRSMGAVAILRAAAQRELTPAAVVLECPFDRMLNTVRNRFRSMGLPSFPGAELLVFWGSRRLGSSGFDHNPVEYARAITTPTVVLTGTTDDRATPEQVRSVFDALNGPKQLKFFDGLGHEPYRTRQKAEWDAAVSAVSQVTDVTPCE